MLKLCTFCTAAKCNGVQEDVEKHFSNGDFAGHEQGNKINVNPSEQNVGGPLTSFAHSFFMVCTPDALAREPLQSRCPQRNCNVPAALRLNLSMRASVLPGCLDRFHQSDSPRVCRFWPPSLAMRRSL
jgi:hypothetical protein